MPEIAVIIPAHNATHFLGRSLPATRACFADAELLVVDDCSVDETARMALALGARVVRLERREGPSAARNAGARELDVEVLLFLDADCVPHPDVPERVRAAFQEDPDLVGLSGSYDARPPETGFFSQYMNLRHHFTHQRVRPETVSFWAGCGAVRRKAFLEAGGFDDRRFPRPSIEDIELAMRLCHFGRVRLDPAIQVTHLKRWTLRSVIETDVRSRAIPWTKLILETGKIPNDLNLRPGQKLAAGLSPFLFAAIVAVPWAAWHARWGLMAVCVSVIATSGILNYGIVRFFFHERGAIFALGGWLFHQLHLLMSAVTFVLTVASHGIRRVINRSSP